MKISVWHVIETSGSVSCGYLGKYRFSKIPEVGDYFYHLDKAEVDRYIVSEVYYVLKKYGRTEIGIHVRRAEYYDEPNTISNHS